MLIGRFSKTSLVLNTFGCRPMNNPMTLFWTQDTPIHTGASLQRNRIVRIPGSCLSFIASLWAAGIAILSKHEPLSVDQTLPNHPDPRLVKGRIITLEFEHCYLIGTYVVNAGRDLKVSIHVHDSQATSATETFHLDVEREERMEYTFRKLHPWFGQEEACNLDRRP